MDGEVQLLSDSESTKTMDKALIPVEHRTAQALWLRLIHRNERTAFDHSSTNEFTQAQIQ